VNAQEKAELGGRIRALLPDGWTYSITFPPKGRTAHVAIQPLSWVPYPYDENSTLFRVKGSNADGLLWTIQMEYLRLIGYSPLDEFPRAHWIDTRAGWCSRIADRPLYYRMWYTQEERA
jgi:hypothetical protein